MSNRRQLLAAVGAAMIATPAFARWEDITRYPDPAIESLDPSFSRYRIASAHLEVLATGFRWIEGPVWFGDQRSLFFSDVPNNVILRWSEESGAVTEFRKPSNFSNGHTRDRKGRLVSCEHLTRRVTRTEHDGSITVLADRFEGKPLNAPNDIVVKSDGSIWFTDHSAGILGWYEGEKAPPELPTDVYRIDDRTRETTRVASGIVRPNGLAFSPDESILYIVEAGINPRNIRAFQVSSDGRTLDAGRIFYQCEAGETPDGFRVDTDGNLWCGWGMSAALDGVRVIDKSGKMIGKIGLPIRCANLAFGGRHRNRLCMTCGTTLMSLYTEAQGAIWPS
jgi:gluconolactonase